MNRLFRRTNYYMAEPGTDPLQAPIEGRKKRFGAWTIFACLIAVSALCSIVWAFKSREPAQAAAEPTAIYTQTQTASATSTPTVLTATATLTPTSSSTPTSEPTSTPLVITQMVPYEVTRVVIQPVPVEKIVEYHHETIVEVTREVEVTRIVEVPVMLTVVVTATATYTQTPTVEMPTLTTETPEPSPTLTP